MSAYRLFSVLMSEEWWAAQGRKVCWLAARYYVGIDSFNDLMALTDHQPCLERHGRETLQKPMLSIEQVRDIVRLR
jgi:hypothetical protein